MTPYYADGIVTVYNGDCREVLPQLDGPFASCVTDPPYGETSATWDRWPTGWVDAVAGALPESASLWFFGSTRMLLGHVAEFAGWRYAQEQMWLKRNGTGPTGRDRLVRVHEWAHHFYRGRWSDLHHEWPREPVNGPDKGHVRRLSRVAAHQRDGRQSSWTDDGTRQPRSATFVVEAPSVRYQKRHQDEKPLACVEPLVRECTPPGAVVLDPFGGSGTTAIAAMMTGRRAVVIEASERFCSEIARRAAQGVLVDETTTDEEAS